MSRTAAKSNTGPIAEGHVLGVDVGWSEKEKSSAVCRLSWNQESIAWKVRRFRANDDDRCKAIRDVAGTSELLAVAIDGPLRRNFDMMGDYRTENRVSRSMRVLIVAPAWIGDMVMAHTLVQVLQREHGNCTIHVVAPPTTAPLATRMPGVAAVHELNVGHGELGLGRRRRLAAKLRNHEIQAAFVLPNTFKSALLPWWAGIPRRVGWYGEARYGLLNDRRRLDQARYPRMIDRFMSLALPAGAPPPEPEPRPELSVDRNNRQSVLKRLNLHRNRDRKQDKGHDFDNSGDMDENRATDPVQIVDPVRDVNLDRDCIGPVTALCPGAEYGEAKRWPAAHFAAVARERLQAGHAVWILGSARDAATTAEITAGAPGAVDLAGRTSLLDAIDLLSLADAVVTNDSGLMHIACALDRRVIAVFGSTSPAFTSPLGRRATVIEDQLDCRPCFQRQCPLKHLNCLRNIAPERVIAALTP